MRSRMFRILLVICMITVGTVQGIAIGKVDISWSDKGNAEFILSDSQTSEQGECCDTNRIIDNIPTFCKLDCKAVVPLADVTEGRVPQKYAWKLTDDHNSVAIRVELGPPKA